MIATRAYALSLSAAFLVIVSCVIRPGPALGQAPIQGGISFKASTETFGDGGSTWIAEGDFNNDGKLDLVTVGQDGSVHVALGAGDGTFKTSFDFAPFNYGVSSGFGYDVGPQVVQVGDFNQDGKLDFIVGAGDGRCLGAKIFLFLGNGDGTFETAPPQPVAYNNGYGCATVSVGVEDLNRDGKLDVIGLNSTVPAYSLTVWLGDSGVPFPVGTTDLFAQGQTGVNP